MNPRAPDRLKVGASNLSKLTRQSVAAPPNTRSIFNDESNP